MLHSLLLFWHDLTSVIWSVNQRAQNLFLPVLSLDPHVVTYSKNPARYGHPVGFHKVKQEVRTYSTSDAITDAGEQEEV